MVAIVEAKMNDIDQEKCPFCVELENFAESLFCKMYGKETNGRIVDSEGCIVALPSIGQIFSGSLMLMPRHHVETIAELGSDEMEELIILLSRLYPRISALGPVAIFEHGAKCETGHGCGIYHAHLHVMPLPSEISGKEVLPDLPVSTDSLRSAYQKLNGASNYILFKDTNGLISYGIISDSESNNYQSQHLRKTLAGIFSPDKEWDWRRYGREDDIVSAINFYCNGSPIEI